MTRIYHILIVMVITLFSPLCFAAVPTWEIVPEESQLTVTGTMNGSPITAEFKSFSGLINFDPNNVEESNANIVVDTASITTSYMEIANTLKGANWFNVKSFPQAVYKCNQFIKNSETEYTINGTLTVLDKTIPLTATFVQEEFANNKARISGKAQVSRTQLGVGQGEWGDTSDVADLVDVNFTLSAIRQ